MTERGVRATRRHTSCELVCMFTAVLSKKRMRMGQLALMFFLLCAIAAVPTTENSLNCHEQSFHSPFVEPGISAIDEHFCAPSLSAVPSTESARSNALGIRSLRLNARLGAEQSPVPLLEGRVSPDTLPGLDCESSFVALPSQVFLPVLELGPTAERTSVLTSRLPAARGPIFFALPPPYLG